jgi:peptidoglycan/xylan/chitin deacetylase (PgdA/CDA1 family)
VALKDAKLAVLKAGKATGLFTASNRLRTQRLLILCYHGISIEDEHTWNPCLYIDPATFRNRLEMLRDGGYRVLPLGEALQLMRQNELPPRSVVITIDDGTYDFYALGYPMLREFGFPATLYLSTFYCGYQAPVFDVACAFMLWKSMGKTFDTRGLVAEPDEREYRIAGLNAWRRIQVGIISHQRELGTSAGEKDDLLNVLASRLGFDIARLRKKRMLHYMTPAEVREVSQNGIDLQLHTHRHRTPRDRTLFVREIEDNVREIQAMSGSMARPTHFCYPCGDYDPEFYTWLKELGVESATTCQPGLATVRSHPFELPRLLDMPTLSSLEFEGWLSGFSDMFPRRDARVLHRQRFPG